MKTVVSFFMTRDEANGHIQMIPEDSIEYRLLQAYTQSKDPAHSHLPQSNGVADPKPSSKKRKKTLKLRKLLRCIQPMKEDDSCVTESHGQQPNPKTCEWSIKNDSETEKPLRLT